MAEVPVPAGDDRSGVRVDVPPRDEGVLWSTALMLRGLYLLGTKDELKDASGAGAILRGPSASVSAIEAGATALSKWWAAGLGGLVAVVWGGVLKFWGGATQDERVAALLGAALVTSALLWAIGYLLATDVRSRAQASTATINARSAIAQAMINASSVHDAKPEKVSGPDAMVAFSGAFRVAYQQRDWWAVALREHRGKEQYLLVRGTDHEWIEADEVEVKI